MEQEKEKKLKPFYLSLRKWRCGVGGNHALGRGVTCLLNTDGYMCCLGQGLKQFDPEIPIFGYGLPGDTATTHPLFVSHSGYNTKFSDDAAAINDDIHLTTEERIVAIEFLLQAEGYKLVVTL